MITPEGPLHRRRSNPACDHGLRDWISRAIALSGEQRGPGDVDLTISSRDGSCVSFAAHRRVLATRSRFFADKLGCEGGPRVEVEICDCDDVKVYVEVVAMMYCGDLRRRLAGEGVQRVLALLMVSAAMMFDTGVSSCLEFLEAAPWSEDDEEKVMSAVGHLQLSEPITGVLHRITMEPSLSARGDDLMHHLLGTVLQGKDEKARLEMKTMMAGLLRDDFVSANTCELDKFQETLYHLCDKSLNSLLLCLYEAASVDENRGDRRTAVGEIAREAGNLQWLVEILIGKKIGEQFITRWADQTELARLHSKVPCMYRFEISRISAELFIAIGKGKILVPGDIKFSLLSTWLEALYEDFHWMKRACRRFDKGMVEDGLCQTILTLSMTQQQVILLRWVNCFLDRGDDCPNIQKAFQVWWRRAFVRHPSGIEDHIPITVYDPS